MNASVPFMSLVCRHMRGFHMPCLGMLRNRGCSAFMAGRHDCAKDVIITVGFSCVDVPFSRNLLDQSKG